jgi:pectinesterase
VVAATANRPQFDMATADANYTISKFLSTGGQVVSTYVTGGATVTSFNVPLADGWDPVTNGIGNVSTFTPMFTVASDGSGNFTSVQAAITAARMVTVTNCARGYILVKPGIYRETVALLSKTTGTPITLYGSDPDASKTVIVFNNASLTVLPGATAALGTSGSATFTQSSLSFQAKNLTFSNDYAETGTGNEQAVAFLNQGDRAQFENVRFLGNQDTLYVKSTNSGTIARAYFRDCYIEGDTDFIFGRGTTVFDHCEVHTRGNNKVSGTATAAPSTEITNPNGFLFISSNFTADSNVAANTTYLARQWFEGNRPQAVGKMIVRNSTIGPHIMPAMPWQPWVGRTIFTMNPDAGAPDAAAPTQAITTPLFTSADYFSVIGGGPNPPEPYIGEYGNTTGTATTSDGGVTDASSNTDAPIQ